jgi:hypothetical protein
LRNRPAPKLLVPTFFPDFRPFSFGPELARPRRMNEVARASLLALLIGSTLACAPATEGGSGSTDTSGTSTGPGGSSSPGTSTSRAPLPPGTLLYVRSETADSDVLVARDLASGTERTITDLRGDGSKGWEIRGYALAPDRTRIVLASLYGPTKADNDTKLATRRLWSLAVDGSDFVRLTPVFENTGNGRKLFTIEVNDPTFSKDGSQVIYSFGNYWYEGTTLSGGAAPWQVPAKGGALPALFPANPGCSVLNPSPNPATGEILFRHSVCVRSADEGLFLYPSDGGAPKKLVGQTYGAGGVDPSLETASWVSDGSGFVFVGTTDVTRNGKTETVRSLFLYDMGKSSVTPLVIPPENSYVQNAAISPDASAIVYCLRQGDDRYDLHLVDLTARKATDVAITTDGKSCHPRF